MQDVLTVVTQQMPASARLGHDGQLLREVSGVSWAVAQLPVDPS